MPFGRSTIHPIGVDIGRECVRMIQLEQAGPRVAVRASARVELTSPEQFPNAAAAKAVRRVLNERGTRFHGRRAVVAVPHELLRIRNVRIPLACPASRVVEEARKALPLDTFDAAIQCIAAGEVRQGDEPQQEVIALITRDSEIRAFLEAFEPSGLVIHSLDARGPALYRAVDRFAREAGDAPRAIANIGVYRTEIAIGQGQNVRFTKSIEIGCSHFQAAITRKFGLTSDETQRLLERLAANGPDDPVRSALTGAMRALMEQLGREIEVCIQYCNVTFRSERPARLSLTGVACGDTQLLAMLNRVLPIPVEVVDYSTDLNLMGSAGDWAITLGLAAKGIAARSLSAAPIESRLALV